MGLKRRPRIERRVLLRPWRKGGAPAPTVTTPADRLSDLPLDFPPPCLIGADEAGLPVEEKSAMRAALEEAVASGSAASVEEKLARLCLDEAPPSPSKIPRVYAGSSSADPPVLPGDEPICRICLDRAELPSRPLVQPCACRGSSTWAHADCLTEWRRTSPKADAAYQCGGEAASAACCTPPRGALDH